MFITLQCGNCDNINCHLCRKYIPEDSKEGCTRKVSEEQGDMFYHYMNEVIPFIAMYKNYDLAQNKLEEIYQFLLKIYDCPIGQLLDDKGKIKPVSRIYDNQSHMESL